MSGVLSVVNREEILNDGLQFEIKFPEVLSRLVEESPYRTKRGAIWKAVGISSAALSQYTLGKARPRFEVLVTLANFFGVSVDYLLTGNEPTRPLGDDSRAVMRHVDWTLGSLQSKIGSRAAMAARVGDVLAHKIGEAMDQVTSVSLGGMLTSDESLALESRSLETCILTVLMDQNVMELDNGEAVIGRFGLVVAANLLHTPPRPYKFLLYEQPGRPLIDATHSLRRLFREELGVPEDRLRFCQFRKTSERVLIGACFYRIDRDSLHADEPTLELLTEDYVTKEGWMGYSINDNSEAPQPCIDARRVSAALATFDELWQAAIPC